MPIWGAAADGSVILSFCHLPTTRFRYPPPDFNLLPPVSAYCCSSFFNKKFSPMIGTHSQSDHFHGLKVKALGSYGGNNKPIAPLQFESPTGQLLSQIMQTHPHLLPAAIDQQLEQLQSDQEGQKSEKPTSSQDLLYRRIAEVREKERQKSLEEIIYCCVVQKFIENDILMIPKIYPSSYPSGQVDSWPNQEQKLEAIHSPDAMEMIHSHLTLILGERLVGPLNTIVEISKLKLGKLYAASIMYGYFLKRVDERYQLERTMNTLPKKKIPDQRILEGLKPSPFWDMDSLVQISADDEGFNDNDVEEGRSYKLRSYVMYLDAETLQRSATIRSKEAISLIENQTQSLFGRPDVRMTEDGRLDTSNDDVVGISFCGLTMLVLEAVAFGSSLWEAESYVECKYHFVIN